MGIQAKKGPSPSPIQESLCVLESCLAGHLECVAKLTNQLMPASDLQLERGAVALRHFRKHLLRLIIELGIVLEAELG